MTMAPVKVEDFVLKRMGGSLGWLLGMGIGLYFDLLLITR